MKNKTLAEIIKENEYDLAKHKFVLEKFPDAKVHNSWKIEYSSKSVNQNYQQLEFEQGWSGLYVKPYSQIEFEFNGTKEIIKIRSNPLRKKVAYISWRNKDMIKGKRAIKFCKLSINLKNGNFKDEMLNSCRTEIMAFIQKNTNCHLDTKNLEPRLQKLLLFT